MTPRPTWPPKPNTTSTPTPSQTLTPSQTPTATDTSTPTLTPTPTLNPYPVASATPTLNPYPVASATPSLTASTTPTSVPAVAIRINAGGPATTVNGSYTLRLHFADTSKTAAGQRRFDVQAEGVTILDNYDVFQRAGGRNRAIVEEATITVSDGTLNLNLLKDIDNVTISGIEIIGN